MTEGRTNFVYSFRSMSCLIFVAYFWYFNQRAKTSGRREENKKDTYTSTARTGQVKGLSLWVPSHSVYSVILWFSTMRLMWKNTNWIQGPKYTCGALLPFSPSASVSLFSSSHGTIYISQSSLASSLSAESDISSSDPGQSEFEGNTKNFRFVWKLQKHN